jgi:dethiobiotin synthetase
MVFSSSLGRNSMRVAQMGKGIFVTGTDTGVGKTVVTACLVSILAKRGFDVGVMKPVETGCHKRSHRLVPRDAAFLKAVSGSGDPLSLINPYRFSKPLAPLIAAEIDHKNIEVKRIHSAYQKLREKHDILFVEGAGGLLVPLVGKLTNLDLILELNLPVLLVVGSKLGAVNHALLTLNWAKENGVKILGVFINQLHPGSRKSLVQKTNPGLIRSFTKVPILGNVPHIPLLSKPQLFSKPALMSILEAAIDVERLRVQIV